MKPHPFATARSRSALSRLEILWKVVMATVTPVRQPILREIKRPSGERHWLAHHPMTGQTAYLASEQEVRIWLEQSYADRSHPWN